VSTADHSRTDSHSHSPDTRHLHARTHEHAPDAHGAHDHTAGASPRRLAIVLALVATVLIAEVVTGLLTGSLALLADAGHMLTDTMGLVIALAAAHLSTRPPTDRSTWGMRRAEVIGAALQAGMLAVVGVVVGVRAVIDLVAPGEIEADGMLVMGAIGLVANIVSMLILAGGRGCVWPCSSTAANGSCRCSPIMSGRGWCCSPARNWRSASGPTGCSSCGWKRYRRDRR